MDKKKQLASHPLMNAVFENIRPTLTKSMDRLKKIAKEGKIREGTEDTLNEYQFYNVNVFQMAHALLNCVYQLQDIRTFIKRFPSPRTYERENISQYRWIEYHYSYFVITLVTLADTALILVNTVFRLGNPEQLCRPEVITSNEWLKDTTVNKRLRQIAEMTSRHRSVRNLSVHRGKAPELYKIFKSDLLDCLNLYSFVNLHAEPIVDKKFVDLAFEGEIKKICESLDKEIDAAKDAIWKLFDSLTSIYQSHQRLLTKTSYN